MADRIYRIVSDIRTVKSDVVHSFSIEERKGFIFKRWSTYASGFEVTDENNNITYRGFSKYEDAEKYLMQKAVSGNYVKRLGNIYEVTFPTYYI